MPQGTLASRILKNSLPLYKTHDGALYLQVESQNLIRPPQHLALSLQETLLTGIVSCEPHAAPGLDVCVLHDKVCSQAA